MELTEDKRAPCKSPELVRVAKRNPASYPDVLGRELLEQVADNPDESAEKQPEEHASRILQL